MSLSQVVLPNARRAVRDRFRRQPIPRAWPLGMLVSRLLLFALWQTVIAFIFLLSGSETAWQDSVAWWPVTITLSNFVCLYLLRRLTAAEHLRLTDLYNVDRRRFRQDILPAIAVTLLAAPLALLPGVWLGNMLFGSVDAAYAVILQPLPMPAVYALSLLFPVTIALSELPTYFGYVMPRLEALWPARSKWPAVLLPVLFLALQHSAAPLIWDWRFIVWRFGMFLPLALLFGLALRRRATLMPYLMVIHALADVQVIVAIAAIS